MDIGKFLNGEPEGEWYKMPNADGVSIRIRNLKPKERRSIVRSCTRRRVKRGAVIEETDDDKLNRLILNQCVVDWKGIEMDGAPLPVTEENKRLLDDNVSEFANLWNSVIGSANELDEAVMEEDLKN